MNKRTIGILLLAFAIDIVALAVWLSYTFCSEAYGSGPPYYGRTTNMDKWDDPFLMLVIGNALALGSAGLLVRTGLRKLGEARRVQ